jgi:DNA-binding CsgD family transcriptional regulator
LSLAVGRLSDALTDGSAIPFQPVCDAVGASYSLLFSEQQTDGRVDDTVVQGVDPAYAQRLRNASAERLLPTWLRDLDTGTVVDRATLQRDHDFARSPFFDYVVRPEGRFHCLISTPYVSDTQRYHLIVGRPFNREDFTPTDIRVLRTLLPYIGRAIALEHEAAAAKSDATSLRLAFDHLASNVLIISQEGRVRFANTGANRLLQIRDGLGLVGDIITASSTAANAVLHHSIQRVLTSDEGSETSLHLPRPSGCPPLQVRILRLDGQIEPAATNGLHAGRVMMVVKEHELDDEVDGWSIGKIYGLSPKELEVSVLLARGQTLRTASSTLGISYNTARCHLRRALDKTANHRQSDLIRMVLNASPRLRR